jgi:signal peptidase II
MQAIKVKLKLKSGGLLKKFANTYGLMVILVTLIIALDQFTKTLVRSNLEFGQIWMPWEWLLPYARVIHIFNTGAAFGLFKGANTVFMILAVIVSCAIIYYFPSVSRKDWVIRVALSMQLAGALGNLIDRMTIGHVTDFVSVGNFPVFNVADASITVGVGVLLIGMWVQEKREKKTRLAVEEEHLAIMEPSKKID